MLDTPPLLRVRAATAMRTSERPSVLEYVLVQITSTPERLGTVLAAVFVHWRQGSRLRERVRVEVVFWKEVEVAQLVDIDLFDVRKQVEIGREVKIVMAV